MANTDINPIVIDANVSDIVEAAYESGYFAGKLEINVKQYWRGVRWGVLACGVGYGVYKLLTKARTDADEGNGMWRMRVEKIQKDLDEALEKVEKEL